jgi:hypothetical protein
MISDIGNILLTVSSKPAAGFEIFCIKHPAQNLRVFIVAIIF